ncbi:unnamed protein product [Rhizoctonia solani]|uniref:Uncharacterized protein n=1 Tax=Rhizoctonia solani TaxID=456999 RepID=A0A8H3CDI1_9AGAM|nr:unnamed protein product [Rhizoctonia solani]
MSIIKPPQLGRPLGSYPFGSDSTRSTLSSDSKIAGLRAVQTISQEADPEIINTGPDIALSSLEATLHLALDPVTIHHLANPAIINGCIRSMQAMMNRNPGIVSLFSHEYGYLCFQLLSIALDTCLLKEWGKLDKVESICDQHPLTSPRFVVSSELSMAMDDHLDELKSKGDSRWVLGWSTSTGRRQQIPLVSRTNVSALCNMLWSDRKRFLEVVTLVPPEASGLSGVMFLLSRYLAHERDHQQDPNWWLLNERIYEITLRYLLVADEYHRGAIHYILDCYEGSPNWEDSPKHLDAEDSRTIMTAFVKKLSSNDIPDILIFRDPGMALRLVSLAIDVDSHDLLPAVFERTIESGWAMFLELPETEGPEPVASLIFLSLLWMICPPYEVHRDYQVNLSTQAGIIRSIRNGEFIDLVARILTWVNLPNRVWRDRDTDLLQDVNVLFEALGLLFDKKQLEIGFRDYIVRWQSVYQLMLIGGSRMSSPHTPSFDPINTQCLRSWLLIARCLALEPEASNLIGHGCSSGRCPGAYVPRFGRSNCGHATYCDDRCQVMDWRFGGYSRPHCQLCRSGSEYVRHGK